MDLHDAFDSPAQTVVLAEGEFGQTGGKTANGVVMHSELFEARVVIDSTRAGKTASDVLGSEEVSAVPVVATLEEALTAAPDVEVLVIGVATAGGTLPEERVDTIQDAMAAGCDIVSGLHVFLSDRPEWESLADQHGVRIFDVRKPPADDELRVADGRIDDVDADVVLTMGTDCAVGKRTTTYELYRAAKRAGMDAGWVATGQTGIMVGAQRGVVVDRVPADFTAGVVEDLVADVAADCDIVFVEGQASLTHRAYSGVTLSILHGSWPDAVVLADEPERERRTHFTQFTVEGLDRECELIESIAETTVAAVSTWSDPDDVEREHGLLAANVYQDGSADKLLDGVLEAIR